MTSLKDKIQEAVKDAMRAKEAEKLGTLRLVMAAIKDKEVAERQTLEGQPLSDEQVLIILDKMVKQRKDSISQFDAAQRTDLADKERAELAIIGAFLPEQLTDTELDALIAKTIIELNATSVKEMGQVMNVIRPQIQGRTDMKLASDKIKTQLGISS